MVWCMVSVAMPTGLDLWRHAHGVLDFRLLLHSVLPDWRAAELCPPLQGAHRPPGLRVRSHQPRDTNKQQAGTHRSSQ